MHDLVPLNASVTRVGRRAAAGLNLLALGALAALVMGVMTLRTTNQEVGTDADLAHATLHNARLQSELVALSSSLEQLVESLVETQFLESETRELAGLKPAGAGDDGLALGRPDVTGIADPSLARALVHSAADVEASLRQARALRRSFEEIVATMEANEDAWQRLPSTRPLDEGRLSSRFGLRRDPFTGALKWHKGMDLVAPTGTPIRASAAGTVIRSGRHGGYGNLVELDHGNGLTTRYAHNSRLAVQVGDEVERGQIIGFVGATGRASAPHLHYEVHLNGNAVNPEPYILPPGLTAD